MQFQHIGETFVKQYYGMFDGNKDDRKKLINFYHTQQSLMSFEGVYFQGASMIIEKIKSFNFAKIERAITSIDCQPTFDGGILINISGLMKMDAFPVCGFSQTFVLKPLSNTFVIHHDIFRVVKHSA